MSGRLRANSSAVRVDAFHAQWEATLAKSLTALELAHSTGHLQSTEHVRLWAARSLVVMGNAEEASHYVAAELALSEKNGDLYFLVSSLMLVVEISRLKGEWETARQANNRGLELSPRHVNHLSTRVVLEYEVGDFHQGENYLDRFVESVRQSQADSSQDYARLATTIPAIAYITGDIGRFPTAERAAKAALSSPSAPPRFVHLARAGLGLMAVQRGDVPVAAEQYKALDSMAGCMLQSGFICFDRL